MTVEIGTQSEEWLKLGDDFVTHKVVHLDEEFVGKMPSRWPIFVEGYLNGYFGLEVHWKVAVGERYSFQFLAVFDGSCSQRACARSLPRGDNVEHVVDSGDIEGQVMLFFDREPVKDVENVSFRVMPSLVRLKMLDKVYDLCTEAFLQSGEIFSPLLALVTREKVESKLTAGVLPPTLSKAPNEVIENRAQIVDSISGNDSESQWWFPFNLEQGRPLVEAVKLFWGDYTVRVGFEKRLGLAFELLDVLPCSLDPKVGKFYIIAARHDEQVTQEDSEDSEGPRDSRPDAGGSDARLQEGGGAYQGEASNSPSPPEEGLTQTSPSPRLGGYTAKHTRSGSPEDA